MTDGLLWYDNDPQRTLAVKVSQAAARYRLRLGRKPTAVLVNVADVDTSVPALPVQVRGNILRHHLLVIDDKQGRRSDVPVQRELEL